MILLLAASLSSALAAPGDYLDRDAVAAWLAEAAPGASCDWAGADLLVDVRVTVDREGQVSPAGIVGAPDPAAACLRGALSATRLAPQPEPAQEVRFTLPVVGGALGPAQDVSAPVRSRAPYLLRLPPRLDEAARGAAIEAIWPARALAAEAPAAAPPTGAESDDDAPAGPAPPAEVYTR